MKFLHVSQACLELLTSSDLPTSASQSAKIIGLSHCVWPVRLLRDVCSCSLPSFFLGEFECSGPIRAHCSLDLLGSWGYRHTVSSWLLYLLCRWGFAMYWGWSWTLELKWFSCLGLPKFCDYMHEPLHLACKPTILQAVILQVVFLLCHFLLLCVSSLV